MRKHLLAAFAALALSGGIAMAQTEDDVEARNRQAIAASFEAWRTGKGGPFELLAEDASWTVVGRSAASGTYSSREAFMREVIRPFNARMRSPLVPEVRRLYADGDTVIVFFDAAGTARDGKPYSNTYAWFLQMRDGKIVRVHAFFDSLSFNDLWQRVTPDGAEQATGSR
jgi:ketosteroid isomerase-like protein